MAELAVMAPLSGALRPLADVPDRVFADGMMGPGAALEPDGTGQVDVTAPVAGIAAAVHPHAFVIANDLGGVLVHLGIDTVQLKGEGFQLLVEQGDEVELGQPIVRWSPEAIRGGGRSALVPVVALAAEPTDVEVSGTETFAVGQLLLRWTITD